MNKKIILMFFSLASILLFITPDSFSEQDDTKQIVIQVDPPRGGFDENPLVRENQEQNNNGGGSGNGPSMFVTGSGYALNGIPIFINTPEGIKLNDQLKDQIELRELEAIHGEKFWERIDQLTYDHYGLAEAILNPNTENKFFVSGGKHSTNVNSNFEYFVLERGFDPRDTSEVPNNIFSPTKYDLARAIMQKIQNPNANNLNVDTLNELDLRLVAPNAFSMTDDQRNLRQHNDIEQRASSMLNNIIPTISGTSSSSDGDTSFDSSTGQSQNTNPITRMSSGSGSSSQQQSALSPQTQSEIFQNTDHIKEIISQENFEPNYSMAENPSLPLFEILASIVIFSAAVVTGFVIMKKLKKNEKQQLVAPVITTKPSIDYIIETQKLLESATAMYNSKQVKNAYERFSQAIRFYYSHHYSLESEVTTFEILSKVKKQSKSEHNMVFDCLALCGIVEFARHKEGKNDFQNCMKKFAKIIAKSYSNKVKSNAVI